jgi:hypothetical protein
MTGYFLSSLPVCWAILESSTAFSSVTHSALTDARSASEPVFRIGKLANKITDPWIGYFIGGQYWIRTSDLHNVNVAL